MDPSRESTVFLCPRGISSMDEVSDWSIRAVVHEMAHSVSITMQHYIDDIDLYILAQSRRTAYDELSVHQLAQWSSHAAIMNAQNYAMYAIALTKASYSGMKPAADIGRARWAKLRFKDGRPELRVVLEHY